METIQLNELTFIQRFATNIKHILTEPIKYRKKTDFLTDEYGKKYLLYFLKNIDSELYLVFLNMLNSNKIIFKDKLKVEESVCNTIINPSNSSVEKTKITIPHLENGISVLTAAHEIGHGLRYENRSGNTRLSVSSNVFEEVTSMLFAKLCEKRYEQDFGYNDQVQAFEVLNTNNAIFCNNTLGGTLDKYEEVLKKLAYQETLKVKNQKEYYSLQENFYNIRKNIYSLISYPIGMSLLNYYLQMDDKAQIEYLRLIVRYMMSNTNIGINEIVSHFCSNADESFYQNNFNQYIEKSQKKLRLVRGK